MHRSRYPDLHAKFCATGRCDTRALHDHFKNEGQTKKWRWGCGSRFDAISQHPPIKGNNYVGVIEELYQIVTAERLSKIARDHRQAYAQADPFPHIVIDGIFPRRLLEAISNEIPEEKAQKNGCYNPKSVFCLLSKTRSLPLPTKTTWVCTRASSLGF